MIKALEGYPVLTHRVSVYVPVSGYIDRKVSERALVGTQTTLSTLFGGASVMDVRGSWVGSHGLEHDDVRLVYSFIGENDFTDEKISKVVDLAKKIKEREEQEEVGLEVDGRFYRINS